MRYLVVVLILAAGSGRSTAPVTWELGNSYALVYETWAKLRNVRVQSPGTISAPEMIRWQAVNTAWLKLKKQVDAEYRADPVMR